MQSGVRQTFRTVSGITFDNVSLLFVIRSLLNSQAVERLYLLLCNIAD